MNDERFVNEISKHVVLFSFFLSIDCVWDAPERSLCQCFNKKNKQTMYCSQELAKKYYSKRM